MVIRIVPCKKTKTVVKVRVDKFLLSVTYSMNRTWISALKCNQSTNGSSFRCSSSSKCLTTADLCNNITDCLQGEDEHDLICGHFCEWPSLSTCDSKILSVQRSVSSNRSCFPEKYPNVCSNVEFYCDGKCVPISHRCDRTPYCCTYQPETSIWTVSFNLDDGADEPYDCLNVTCPRDFFKCASSGKCIPLEKVCDNFGDCPPADKIKSISDDETPQACSRSRPSSSLKHGCLLLEDFLLNHLANSTATSTTASRVPITCESADLFRCKTSHFCINRTYVCE